MYFLFAIISILLDFCCFWTGVFIRIGVSYFRYYGFKSSIFIQMFGPGCVGIVLLFPLFFIFNKILLSGKAQAGGSLSKKLFLILSLPLVIVSIWLLLDYYFWWFMFDDPLLVFLTMLLGLVIKIVGFCIIWHKQKNRIKSH